MSKQIEPSHTLSDFDRQYLIDRGKNPDDYILPAEAEEVEETPEAEETPVEDSEEEDDEDVPYEEWTTDELRTELKRRGLKQAGREKELIARLEEHDATIADGDA